MLEKTCKTCDLKFEIADPLKRSDFNCPVCHPKKIKAYQEKNKERISAQVRNYQFKKKYGISTKEYNEILELQDKCCAICKQQPTVEQVRLAVDHDHVTLSVRGLLCTNCNLGVGCFNDNIARLLAAAEYLRKGPITKEVE